LSGLELQLLQVAAAVLALGNVEIGGIDGAKAEGAGGGGEGSGCDALDTVGAGLGVAPAAVAEHLLTKTLVAAGRASRCALRPDDARAQRDAFARLLYSLLFQALAQEVSACLLPDGCARPPAPTGDAAADAEAAAAAAGTLSAQLLRSGRLSLGVMDVAGFEVSGTLTTL
jgi:hypothetical protein